MKSRDLKKKIICSLVILCLLLSISCSSRELNNRIDSVNFNYLTSIKLDNDEEVEVYKLENYNQVFYSYRNLDISLVMNNNKYDTSKEWIVNYIYRYDYVVNSENISENLYEYLKDNIIKNINEVGGFHNKEFITKKNGEVEEREINVTSMIIDECEKNGLNHNDLNIDKVMIFDMYIPYKIKYTNSFQTYVVAIPVYSFLGFKNNNNLILDGNIYDYNDFLEERTITIKENGYEEITFYSDF